jgi:PAS domain S-box-containing protein
MARRRLKQVPDFDVHHVELEARNLERYIDLYDFAPVGYCTLDAAGHIQDINLRGAELLGAPRRELRGRLLSTVAPLEDSRRFRTHLKQCVETKARVTNELAFSLGKRGTRTVQIISDPVVDSSGATIGCRTAFVDISETKQLENKLRLLSEAGPALTSSLDSAAILDAVARIAVPALAGLCMVDVLGESEEIERPLVVFADPSRQKLLSRKLKQLTPSPGQTIQARVIESGKPVLLPELSDQIRERIIRRHAQPDAMRAAGIRSLIVVPLFARGRTFGALTLAAVASHQPYSFSDLQLAQDLATRTAMAMDNARLYVEAQRAIAARDTILALVSHDLKNPLAVIFMTAARMLKAPGGKDRRSESRKFIESVHRSAERMNRLIQDLLDVSSIEAGRLSIDKRPQSVASLVVDAVEAVQGQAAARSLRLETRFPQGNLCVYCDADRVSQVLANLLGNAIKFTEPGGTILVRVEPRTNDVCFSVADTGPGIPAVDLPHVFDRFWRNPNPARKGTGLGLSIAKGIVEAHGSHIWVESQVGRGSVFFFTLPLTGR